MLKTWTVWLAQPSVLRGPGMTKAVENGRRFAAGDDRVLPEIPIGREDNLADAMSRPGFAPASFPTRLMEIKPLLASSAFYSKGRNSCCSFDAVYLVIVGSILVVSGICLVVVRRIGQQLLQI